MLAVASNLFGKSSSLSAYTLHTPTSSPAASSSNLASTSTSHRQFNVGLWKVVPASHKTTSKEVSVWIFEKRVLDGIRGDSSGRGAAAAKEWVVEQLKKEATSLSRLRHPDILHMVEPLEETRTELTFVTEAVGDSLGGILSAASPKRRGGDRPPGHEGNGEVDLDEVEIQKGVLQIAKGLSFLHTQARSVHLNISPDAILVNAKGDWKLSGLGLTTPLQQPDGSSTKYTYPEVDHRLPPQVQWKLDYLAPEYALDSQLTPANDLYSLGCVLHAVHMGGKPPFGNGASMSSLREHAEGDLQRRSWASGSRWDRCSAELKGVAQLLRGGIGLTEDLLPRLLTRQPSNRLSLASLPSHSFFSSLAISTLNFLDPTTFASKPREEKATFLRGLVRVLPTFSERLRKSKVLPSLLEEMKDPYLLPFILPNVFEISKGLSQEGFNTVLPKLQPLFALKDPPQNMLTLLENLSLFEEKTTPPLFREHVMPLIYNSLECEHLPVQEKALKLVPHLCEILDYGTVQNVLLVKVAILFTRTKILTIKVQTLECFEAMVKTLDKATLTTKLVPLLAKIKTKEPAVMMATLNVHAAMGAKVDREAIATLVLPQLWAMSMGPLLNADQFGRFMEVIKSLGSRVESEHSQHLRDVRRLEAQTASYANGLTNGMGDLSMNGHNSVGEVDFEALVKGTATPVPTFGANSGGGTMDPWDDGWADSLSDPTQGVATQSPFASFSPAPAQTSTSPPPPLQPSARVKGRAIPSSSFNSAVFGDSSSFLSSTSAPPSSSTNGLSVFAPIQPSSSRPPAARGSSGSFGQMSNGAGGSSAPNYNISLSPQSPSASASNANPMSFMSPPASRPSQTHRQPSLSSTIAPPPSAAPLRAAPMPVAQSQVRPAAPAPAPSIKPPPGWTPGLMTPSVKAAPAIPPGAKNLNWDDFDPLK